MYYNIILLNIPYILPYQSGYTSRYVNGDMRLSGPTTSYNQGRVEVFFAGQWNAVCRSYFNTNAANVVCRHFAWSQAISWTSRYYSGSPRSVMFKNIQCTGTENKLNDCRHAGLQLQGCSSSFAYVYCG